MKNKLLKGAIIISIGGFITKLIGAVYRTFLTNILGSTGIGLYQMAFPLYSLLLTLSSTGVPNGIARQIASGEDKKVVLYSSLKLFIPVGLIAFILMALFSRQIAMVQGNTLAKNCYLLLSPSLLFVSVISCFRGYFQGQSNMTPTAFSQILEQMVKGIFGLTLCYFFRNNVVLASGMATLSVTISELVTMLYFFLVYKKKQGNFSIKTNYKSISKKLFLVILPIMLSTLVLPTVRTIESFMIVNILKNYLDNATSLYGIYSGGVESIIGVPVSICYGIAVSLIPEVAKQKDIKSRNAKIYESIFLTIILAVLFSLLLYAFSGIIVKVLYPSLYIEEKLLMIKMLKISAITVILLPLMQTSVAILISQSKTKVGVISGVCSGVIKLFLTYFLLKIPKINIFATIFTDIISYFVACFCNLVYIVIITKKGSRKNVQDNYCGFRNLRKRNNVKSA